MSASPLSNARKAALFAVVLLSVFGIGVGVYMSWHHELAVYGPAGAFGEIAGCQEAEGVSCDVVNTSEWSEIFGIPQFTLAIPAYFTLIALSLYAIFKEKKAAVLAFGLGVLAVLYSAFLAYISKVELGTWCLWCIRLYVTNGLVLALTGFAAFGAGRPGVPSMSVGTGAFLLSFLAAVGGQRAYRGTLLDDSVVTEALPEVAEETTKKDQEGDAPVLSWTVQTEDGNTATLTTSPGDAWKGNRESKVAIVEFADFECGYCKRASGQLRRLAEAYKDKVVFIYKHFPMDPKCNSGVNNRKHRYACQAAEAAVCMQQQDLFWPFHDLVFKNQHQLKAADLIAYAEKVGGDVDTFKACMVAHDGLAQVQADGEAGKAIDLHGTPRIWVDGKLYRAGQSAEQMARALELALGADPVDATKRAQEMREKPVAVTPIAPDVPEMQTVRRADGTTFEIDTFEAGLQDGKATVGKHQIPGTRMSWFAARDACQAAGKRLCTEEEWVTACQGLPAVDDDGDGEWADDMVEGNTYPYGDYHNRRNCWDGRDRKAMRPVYTGEMPACVSKDGVYDLTGNVEEWVGTSPENAVLLGGAFDTSKDHARCYRRNATFGAGYANARTGFRCCR